MDTRKSPFDWREATFCGSLFLTGSVAVLYWPLWFLLVILMGLVCIVELRRAYRQPLAQAWFWPRVLFAAMLFGGLGGAALITTQPHWQAWIVILGLTAIVTDVARFGYANFGEWIDAKLQVNDVGKACPVVGTAAGMAAGSIMAAYDPTFPQAVLLLPVAFTAALAAGFGDILTSTFKHELRLQFSSVPWRNGVVEYVSPLAAAHLVGCVILLLYSWWS